MRPSELLTAVSERVTRIEATPYQQGLASEVLHEATTPWGPGEDHSGIAHLAFVPVITRSPLTNERGAPGEEVMVASELEVQFCYRLRPGAQTADFRLALDAAADICRAVNDTASWGRGCSVDILDLGQAFPPGDDDEFMLIRTLFRVHHAVEV